MTLSEIQTALREALKVIATSRFDIEIGDVTAETPPKIELGDFAFPVAFEMAKRLKQATGDKQESAPTEKGKSTAVHGKDRTRKKRRKSSSWSHASHAAQQMQP